MPRISVVVPTLRVGGLDILFAGLERQTFRDFELVLVDSLYKFRRDLIEQKSSLYSFPVRHVEPINNPFPLNSYQRCVNTGLVYATGKLCYFTCDYSWLPPDCLQVHANFHDSADGNTSLLGSCNLLDTPQIHPNFPQRYGLAELGMGRGEAKESVLAKWDDESIRHEVTKKWCDDYCLDLISGKLNNFMWTIFDPEFSIDKDPYGLGIQHVEMKSSLLEGFLQPQFCHLKNDSIPTERLLSINGFDEAFDGCHGWQDSEVADRLSMRLGMRWYLKPNCKVHITDVHHLMIIRKMLRPEASNEAIYLAKHATGYPGSVNDWDLFEKRKELSIVSS